MRKWSSRSFSKKWLAGVVAFVIVVIVLAFTVGSGQWQIRPILSGSMRPGFPVGGVAVTERQPLADLRLRDVVVTHPPGQPHFDLIHRIIQIKSESAGTAVVQTMGDANSAPDPFIVTIRGPWIYKVRFTVPLVGYPAVALHSVRGRRILLGVAVLLVVIVAFRMWLEARDNARRPRTTDSVGDEAPGDPDPSPRGGLPPNGSEPDSINSDDAIPPAEHPGS